jgi:hypothetical protein
MKLSKVIVLLLLLIATAVAAMPVSADGPGANEDPFGGFPFDGRVIGGIGIVAKFGLSPYGNSFFPGGSPSLKSGDGTTPRKAISINGIWFEQGDRPAELTNCSTVKMPAGTARWFKMQAYEDRRIWIWLDDELNGATKPSGSAVFGAADEYMVGTQAFDAWQRNAFTDDVSGNYQEGFVLAIYSPDSLRPNYAYPPPNAGLLTFETNGRGLLLQGVGNLSLADVTGTGIVGYGSFNPDQTGHLLWYEGQHNGWVYAMAYNQMVWDGVASVCSQRVW